MDALFRRLSNNANDNDNSSGLAPPPGMRQGILPFLSVEINRTVFVVNIDSSTMMTIECSISGNANGRMKVSIHLSLR